MILWVSSDLWNITGDNMKGTIYSEEEIENARTLVDYKELNY